MRAAKGPYGLGFETFRRLQADARKRVIDLKKEGILPSYKVELEMLINRERARTGKLGEGFDDDIVGESPEDYRNYGKGEKL